MPQGPPPVVWRRQWCLLLEGLTASSSFAQSSGMRELLDVSGEKHSVASILAPASFFPCRTDTQLNLVIVTLIT